MLKLMSLPRNLVVGGGAVAELTRILAGIGVVRPLFVVDPALLEIDGYKAALASCVQAGLEPGVFAGVLADPTDTSVEAAAAAWRAGAHDGVVAFGGGSAMDTAKAASLLVSQAQPLSSLKMPAAADLPALPIIAVPTTAGTGSEVTRACVITDSSNSEKMLIISSACMPAASIVDYELTLSCPPRVTADTGLDALTHAIEALVNRRGGLHAAAMALSALRLIGPNLVTAFEKPDNRQAREAMAVGALHAGLAINASSTALVHGMGRPLGAHFHVAHGLSNAMLLPVVTAFSLGAAPASYASAARALGWAHEDATDEAAGDALLAGLRRTNRLLLVPTLRDSGIDLQEFTGLLPLMAEQALQSGAPANNPRLVSAAQIVSLFKQAWDDPQA